MRTPRRPSLAVVVVLTATVALAAAAAATAEQLAGSPAAEAQAWRSAFEPRPRLELRDRAIVLLAAPSLAERVDANGSLPTPKAQRRFVAEAERLQRRLIAALRARGVKIRREHVFTRVLNGFSARLDARTLAALEQMPGVAGVYPVRAVYPAGLSATALGVTGATPGLSLPGSDGAGVTVALLDGGVDRRHPALAGRVLHGVDLVDSDTDPSPTSRPGSNGELDTHGTRMAALIVGRGGSTAVSGVAPGAHLLPIRILGWQPTADGGWHPAGRSDVLLAGIERAVDPDGDGDVEDAARIALAAVVEPYASFPDSPETRAVEGATRLGTLVVAAAGNDGPGGAGGPGTVGAPASAPTALAVGAADLRASLPQVRLTLLAGETVLGDVQTSLLGGVAPGDELAIPVADLRGVTRSNPELAAGRRADGIEAEDFVGPEGVSLVAGKAVVLAADGRPLRPRLAKAERAGAQVVLVRGSLLPDGALGLDEQTELSTIAIPASLASKLEQALSAGKDVVAWIRPGERAPNEAVQRVAPFSSGGLGFGGWPKPDLVAPGVGLLTADPGRSRDGGPRYAVVTGTSAAAAVAAGAAALVASARPDLDAAALRAVLVGSARPLEGSRPQAVTAQGAGLVDPVAADAAELVVTPSSLTLGRVGPRGSTAVVPVTVRNVSVRPRTISFGVAVDVGSDPQPQFSVDPASATLAPTEQATVRLVVRLEAGVPGPRTLSGVIVVSSPDGPPARVPWAATIAGPRAPLVGDVSIAPSSIQPPRHGPGPPAVLRFRAGSVAASPDGTVVEPVGRLDIELWRGSRLVGVLARLRDLLPGRYAIGITGRAPNGRPLAPGEYRLVLRAEGAAPAEGRAGNGTISVPLEVERRKR